jgi:pimeloyl-ACP methyl ester carboxylesterase
VSGHSISQYTGHVAVVRALVAAVVLAGLACAQGHVSFRTPDGWTIHADLYGTGDRGVVLAHGGRFEKGSWGKQARTLTKAGFRVLAIDLRGFGPSKEGPQSARSDFGSPLDVSSRDTVRSFEPTHVLRDRAFRDPLHGDRELVVGCP